LDRALSRAGAATRTEAARLVAAGRVLVNGRPAAAPSLRVDPSKDRIEVDGAPLPPPPSPDALRRLRGGTVVDRKPARPLSVEVESEGPKSAWLLLALAEGRNREVRRLAAGAGLEVEHLVRLAYGPVLLGGLAPGAFRVLGEEEVRALREATAPPPTRTSRPRSSR
ncbi:MAG: hypothetical protein L6R43_13810, partial [Planctomycetes bacterium]|nr:hypothetical protein [Planctomycetota bacterium]